MHDQAPTAAATEWGEIADLYGELARLMPTPIVELNRAVAVAMAEGPQRGLHLLDTIPERASLDGNHLYHAARGDLLARLGRHQEATEEYTSALALATTTAEQKFLARRLDEVGRN